MNLVTLRNAPALLPGVMAALLVPVGPAPRWTLKPA